MSRRKDAQHIVMLLPFVAECKYTALPLQRITNTLASGQQAEVELFALIAIFHMLLLFFRAGRHSSSLFEIKRQMRTLVGVFAAPSGLEKHLPTVLQKNNYHHGHQNFAINLM